MGFKEFLKKIQEEDERSKKKLIIWVSVVIMIVVVAVWLKFFGGFLAVKFPKI